MPLPSGSEFADYNKNQVMRTGNEPLKQKPLLNLWALIGNNPLDQTEEGKEKRMEALEKAGKESGDENETTLKTIEAGMMTVKSTLLDGLKELRVYHREEGKKNY